MEDSEGHDRKDAMEYGAMDCACVLRCGQAVHVRSSDRWCLVEEELPKVVRDSIRDDRLGQGGCPPKLAACQKCEAVFRR